MLVCFCCCCCCCCCCWSHQKDLKRSKKGTGDYNEQRKLILDPPTLSRSHVFGSHMSEGMAGGNFWWWYHHKCVEVPGLQGCSLVGPKNPLVPNHPANFWRFSTFQNMLGTWDWVSPIVQSTAFFWEATKSNIPRNYWTFARVCSSSSACRNNFLGNNLNTFNSKPWSVGPFRNYFSIWMPCLYDILYILQDYFRGGVGRNWPNCLCSWMILHLKIAKDPSLCSTFNP